MAQNQAQSCDFTLEVWGEGIVTAVPDRTLITLGTVSEGIELQEVQSDNAAAVASIIEGLENSGIARENIKTVQYTVEPQYDYIDGKQQFRGYKVTHLLQVMINNVTDAGRVIDTAVANGANIVTSIEFQSSDSTIARQEALMAAVRNAESKAVAIAQSIGVSLSAIPCKVEEVVQSGTAPLLFKSEAVQFNSTSTSIEPGQLTFKAGVRVWYMYG